MINCKIDIEIKSAGEILKNHDLEDGGRAQHEFATLVLKEIDPYVPFRSGELKNSATRNLSPPYKELFYNVPYAARMYYNPQYHFSGAPIRGAYWDSRMWADKSEKITSDLERFINGN